MCSKSIAKFLLIIINIIFFILGAVALGIGLFVLFDQDGVVTLMGYIPEGGTDVVDIPSLLRSSAYVLITGGACIFLIGFLGCCGALKEVRFFLILYLVIVSVILIIEVAAAAIAFVCKNLVEDKLQAYLKKSIADEYKGVTTDKNGNIVLDSTAVSLAWDSTQIKMECCGSVDYTDYDNAKKWPGQYNITVGDQVKVIDAKLPITCCKFEDTSYFPKELDSLEFVDVKQCLEKPSSTNANLQGCYQEVKGVLTNYMRITIGVVLGVIVIEILGIWCACHLCKVLGKEV